jgi:hypothetical protein
VNPLYNYAARNWEHHIRTTSTDVIPLISTFLKNQAKVSASSQALMVSKEYRYGDYSKGVPKQLIKVRLAAYFGLTEMTSILLKIGYQSDCKNTYGQTPLSLAAENGHETVVRLLVDRADINADSKDEDGQTPLSRAAANGQEAVVSLLVDSRLPNANDTAQLRSTNPLYD